MDLKQVLNMWEEDSVIPRKDLDETSRQTPSLHAKYMKLLSEAKLMKHNAEKQQKTLLKQKWLYYHGKMTSTEIEALGWEFDPFNGLRVLKGEMNYYYDADTDIQKSEERIMYWKTLIESLTDIVDSLKWRHQTIRNMISWRQFEAGG